MAEAQRYRSSGTEHFRETEDIRNILLKDVETGQVFMNRTTEHPFEQYYYSPDHFCVDSVGFPDRDNPLSLSHEVSVPPLVSYTAEHTVKEDLTDPTDHTYRKVKRVFEGWGQTGHALGRDEQEESDVAFVTKAVGALNPSRANFQAAAFLAELRDVPSLLKNVGDELAEQGVIRGSGGQYLKAQYGFKPLISDIRTFFNAADKVRNRMKTLVELRGKGKIRRQYRPKAGEGVDRTTTIRRLGQPHYMQIHPDSEDYIYWEAHTTMVTTRWVDVEFTLDTPSNLFSPGDSERWDEAHRLVYGTTLDGPTLWQGMPWSWLIDWSTNMSDYIKSQNNLVGCKFSKAVLMKTSQCDTTTYPVMDRDPGFNGQWTYTFIPGRTSTTYKERILDIVPAAVTTTEPILNDGFRASILGGLTAQRFRPSGRINF